MSRRGWMAVAVAALIVVPVALALWLRGDASESATTSVTSPAAQVAMDTSARAPDGVRIRVRVLNGSGRNGLARRATQQLRDHGYDVVDYTSAGNSTQLTEVQVTAATRAWGERITKALVRGQLREREGSLGYVDVVVLLGHDWQPSPQSFRP